MRSQIGNLESLTKSQEDTINELKSEIAKITNIGQYQPKKEEKNFEPCTVCNRKVPEITKEIFLIKQEKLLKEIERNKEELAENLKALEKIESEQENVKEMGEGHLGNEAVQQIFNIGNLGMLQELLEQAEESDEVLLFTDHKQQTWQIISRNDINVGDGNNIKVEPEIYDVNDEEDKEKKMIKSKNLVIDVEKIENEHVMAGNNNEYGVNENEKEERVSVIEDMENNNNNNNNENENENENVPNDINKN